MTIPEYEADLSVLEELCSELEESALLLDDKQNILWINSVLKIKIKNHNPHIDLLDGSAVKNACDDIYGYDTFSPNSS